MLKEIIKTAKTVDDAVAEGARELGASADKVGFEIIEEARRGILGIGAADAKVRVYLTETPALKAKEFVETTIKNMSFEAEVKIISEEADSAEISVEGEGLGLLIGRHGDVLDSLQYLTTIAANKGLDSFYRITVDVENYRQKRAETLKTLARRMAEKVLKYKRSFSLEPMNAYERRIIHSECQEIDGISTYSIGEGDERKIVITPEKKSQ